MQSYGKSYLLLKKVLLKCNFGINNIKQYI